MLLAVTPLIAMLWIWGIVTCVLIGLVIYRTLIGMEEDDQLFLGSSVLEARQKEIVGKLERISPYLKGFGWASALLLLLIAGFSLYNAFTHFQGG